MLLLQVSNQIFIINNRTVAKVADFTFLCILFYYLLKNICLV